MATLADVKRQAFKLTVAFEGRGYTNLTGNGDDMGISFGMFQWNLGQGTLQGMILRMHGFNGAAFHQACTVECQGEVEDLAEHLLKLAGMKPAAAVKWAAERMDKENPSRFAPEYKHWVEVFRNLGNHPDFQAIQNEFAEPYWRDALDDAKFYGLQTEIGVTFFLDTSVQNGQGKVGRARKASPAHELFLAKGGFSLQPKDRLLVLAQSIAATSRLDKNPPKGRRQTWIREDVLARKYAIACNCFGRHETAEGLVVPKCGWVHGRPYFVARDYRLRDVPVQY